MRLLLSLAVLLCGSLGTAVAQEGTVLRSEVKLNKPRSRDPVLGGSREQLRVCVWIPPGVKTVRGAVVNPFAKAEPPQAHWRAACTHWQFAHVATDFDAVQKNDFDLLLAVLKELAESSTHAELAAMPLCFTGMSRGGGMSMQLAERWAERTLATAPVCLEVGPTTDAGRRLPALTIFGEKDGQQMKLLRAKLPEARKLDAQWAIAVQWNRRHEFGQANNLTFVLFDEAIRLRLPGLKPLAPEDGWLGVVDSWNNQGVPPEVFPAKDYRGEREKTVWFPSERVARTWQAFVAASREVTIASPAGLGDGQAFTTHRADQLISVRLNIKGSPTKVVLWSGQTQLGEKTAAPWEFEVKLPAGIHPLYAMAIEDKGMKKCSRPHTIVVVPDKPSGSKSNR
jgi:dienelactone hydrolase